MRREYINDQVISCVIVCYAHNKIAVSELFIEEFIVCGLDDYPYDIIELYERKKNER